MTIATRDCQWPALASMHERDGARVLYATPYLGTLRLPGVEPHDAGAVGGRCVLLDPPAAPPITDREPSMSTYLVVRTLDVDYALRADAQPLEHSRFQDP